MLVVVGLPSERWQREESERAILLAAAVLLFDQEFGGKGSERGRVNVNSRRESLVGRRRWL